MTTSGEEEGAQQSRVSVSRYRRRDSMISDLIFLEVEGGDAS